MTVHFIGAGPGAADLVTVRAARLIAACRVCLYAGALVPRELLDTAPDAVFIGGGLTTPLLVETCWDALPAGGRLVANAVTVEGEAVLVHWHARVGGELVRIEVQRAEPVGSFTGWKPAMPVTIWSVTRW